MADFLDNLELGAAGIYDYAFDTHHAAEVFATQTAVDPHEQQRLYEAAAHAEDTGALGQAAHQTVNQVVDGWTSTTKVLLGIGAAAAGVVLALQLRKVIA